MNIHEYQAKELMMKFGVATPIGYAASTPEEADAIAQKLGSDDLVVKAQIHAGGRGKGTFTNGFKSGVHILKSRHDVKGIAEKMLGQTLVTAQTGPSGRLVNKVLVAEARDPQRELYLAILIDRAAQRPVVIASTEGGMDIEKVAEETPHLIYKEFIDPALGLQPFQARKIAKALKLNAEESKQAVKLFHSLYNCFIASDCSLVEINPLCITTKGEVMALDAKFNFDDNALFRHADIVAYRDTAEEDAREVEASKFSLNYIGLDGNIACLVNGAGLAMATMDTIKYFGGEPANFLDVGGGANEQQVTEAFKILVSDKNVKAILVNIFGGIMKCDVIAQGILNAVKAVSLPVPLVVRLEGTNVQAGKKLIHESGLPVITADDLADAAQKAVAAARSV